NDIVPGTLRGQCGSAARLTKAENFEPGREQDGLKFYWSNENEDELIKTDFGRPAQLFACAIYGASRLVHLRKPVRPATTRSGRGADPARAAATCRSDRLVPRRTRCADSRRLHLSNRDCRGGPLDAKSFEPQGRRVGERGRQTGLGSQRKGYDAIPVGSRKHGQEPLLDLVPWRGVCLPAAGCDRGRPDLASAGSQCRPSE